MAHLYRTDHTESVNDQRKVLLTDSSNYHHNAGKSFQPTCLGHHTVRITDDPDACRDSRRSHRYGDDNDVDARHENYCLGRERDRSQDDVYGRL